MSLQTMPIDTNMLEFRYHGASEFKPYNQETEKREKEQARDEDTGYPIYSIRCQVIFRNLRESGLVTIRVPLPEPPPESLEFEHPISFVGATSKPWNMNGQSGQTWTATGMTVATANAPPVPPSSTSDANGSASRKRPPQPPAKRQATTHGVPNVATSGGARFDPSVATMRNTTTTQEPIMLFGVAEAANVLGIGRTNVYALMKSGELRSVKIGGRRLIPRPALEAFIDQLMKAT